MEAMIRGLQLGFLMIQQQVNGYRNTKLKKLRVVAASTAKEVCTEFAGYAVRE